MHNRAIWSAQNGNSRFTDSYLSLKDAEFVLKGLCLSLRLCLWLNLNFNPARFPPGGDVSNRVWSLSPPAVKQPRSGPYLVILVNGNIGTSEQTRGNRTTEAARF